MLVVACGGGGDSTIGEAGTEVLSGTVGPADTRQATTTAQSSTISTEVTQRSAISVVDPDTATTAIPGSTAATGTVPDTSSTSAPATTPAADDTTSANPAEVPGSPQTVRIRFESRIADVSSADLQDQALTILNDPRGWVQAGFTFVADDGGPYVVVLAEGSVVDGLCLPLRTFGTVSCQNGPVVALNADRWRSAVDHWTLGVDVYRGYLVNHEVGHLIGMRHPKPRCPVPGRPAGVMEQQTAGLEGCVGNPWPREWELDYARQRPVVYAPLPDWAPEPVPANRES